MPNVGSSRDGKPVNVGDHATIVGEVTAISGSGATALVTVLLSSGVVVTPQAQDMYTPMNS